MNINWNELEVVIFDVDGTLYNQSILRKQMALQLLGHYLVRPWNLYDLQVIRIFRKEREKMCLEQLQNLEEAQYERCAQKVNRPSHKVKALITRWMYQAPLPLLAASRFAGIQEFFTALHKKGIKIAIYSDYPASEKLAALGLEADLVVSSTDKAIDSLKPNPAALRYICEKFHTTADKCLFFGDRDELDGECARQAGMSYYILSEQDKQTNFYGTLARSVKTVETLEHKL